MLRVDVLNHVVAQQSHGEVVVAADDACEDREASHGEEDVFNDLGSVHISFFNQFSNYITSIFSMGFWGFGVLGL